MMPEDWFFYQIFQKVLLFVVEVLCFSFLFGTCPPEQAIIVKSWKKNLVDTKSDGYMVNVL